MGRKILDPQERKRRRVEATLRWRRKRIKPKGPENLYHEYLEQMEKFHEFCRSRELNFRVEIAEMLKKRMNIEE